MTDNMQVYEIGTAIFKRDTNGKVRVWYAETGSGEYKGRHGWAWRTVSGIQDGKMVTSEWMFVEEKNVGRANSTTLEIQASNEMFAEYKKKRDRGYFDKLDSIDTFDKFKPMLAHSYDDYELDFAKEQLFSQPKLDGIRCVARKDGLWTRAGKPIVACPHVESALAAMFDQNPNLVIDGELYNHDLKDDFNKITSLVRKAKPTVEDLEESQRLVQYHVYDMFDPADAKKLFIDRYETLGALDLAVQLVETRAVFDSSDLNQLYADYLEAGYEGQMVRRNTMYENKRSKNLLKRKEFVTEEIYGDDVVQILEGQGNWQGCVKHFVLRYTDGTVFQSGVRGDQTTLRGMWQSAVKPDWVTLRRFSELTPDGIPRFPVVIDWGMGIRQD